MRLSEKRIYDLSKKIAQSLVDENSIEGKVGKTSLTSLLSQTMIQYFQEEEKIDQETREQLLKRRNLPQEGTGEYEALFSQTKEAIARRKGYPL